MQIYLLAFAVMVALVSGVVKYHNTLTSNITTLQQNNAKLTVGIEQANAASDAIVENYNRILDINHEVTTQFAKIQNRVDDLEGRLGRHDIGVLGVAKPKLIEKIINNGTKDSNRCFEIVSGSKLTEDEENATKKSQSNTICPDIANPKLITD